MSIGLQGVLRMKKLKFESRGQESNGFTLIELLLVIVVLGILAAIVVFSLGSVTTKAWVSNCQSDGANINMAIQDFRTETGAWPTSTSDLISSSGANGGPYIGQWPSANGHYTFTLAPANDGTFIVTTPANSTGVTWAGAATCTNPTLQLQ